MNKYKREKMKEIFFGERGVDKRMKNDRQDREKEREKKKVEEGDQQLSKI